MTPFSRSGLSILTLRHPVFWKRSLKHRLSRIMIFVAIAYFAILVFLLLLEDQFLYGPRDVELDKPPAGVVSSSPKCWRREE
jgi:amino acid permease